MFLRCDSTVPTDMPRWAAISLLEYSADINWMISNSLGVSMSFDVDNIEDYLG